MGSVYSKEDCIEALEKVAEDIGKSPTYKEYQNADVGPAASTIKRIFGSWNNAKEASSLEKFEQEHYNIGEVPDRVPFTQDEWEEATADRRQVWRKRTYVEKKKLERGCKECGYDEFSAPLSFHHRNPDEKTYGVSELVHGGKSYEKIDNEIAKCDVVCANCHMVIEYGR